ncbi:MAG: Nramp family divalent metal transporter [Planctomycetaceae bacterium]|nr:Nramp family divalent metal transporter [Planctomycetaceae bacterium]
MTLPHEIDDNTLPPSQDPEDREGQVSAPSTLFGSLAAIGPGLIIAGSIVGSGELIATTKTGAQAGISLLWLIIVGCLIKVFVQVELGRYTISHGESTLAALNRIPGPKLVVNWLIWYWVAMMIASMGQLGGIVAGVGQSLAISFPITGDYARAIQVPAEKEIAATIKWRDLSSAEREQLPPSVVARRDRGAAIVEAQLERLGATGAEALKTVRAGLPLKDPKTKDQRIYAIGCAIITAFVLYFGRYNLIQTLTTALVVAFTFITVGNVISLQMTDAYHIPLKDIWKGLSFGLPPSEGGVRPVETALATFGIIGVGATELIAYPYWCLEKGYARFAGRAQPTDDWVKRARGWIRVMHLDAFTSMIVYTLATVAFYLMGVAVLYNEGRDPAGMRMVSTLATAYVPVFGDYARWLFLIGAFAVLYSTYVVASAGHARTVVDALKLCGVIDRFREDVHRRALNAISFAFPLICLVMYLTVGEDPVQLVLWSGVMQALMLPMLAAAALYLRYTRTDRRLVDIGWWDVGLIVSSLGMLLAGGWLIYSKLA